MRPHEEFLPSAKNRKNEGRFWDQLKESNSPEVVRTVEKIIEWLRAKEFGLHFGSQPRAVRMFIGVKYNEQFRDTRILIASRSSVSSPDAEVRFQYRYMKAGRFDSTDMKIALQKKILREGFPMWRRSTTDPTEWSQEFFEGSAAHFYVKNIDDENLDGFYRIIQFVKDIIAGVNFEPTD